LGKYFETMIVAATIEELIEKGFLSKFRVFATGHPDLDGVRVVAGDYQKGELSEAMRRGTLVADVVETWKERWGKDKTFVFGVDCAHAQALQERFLEAGITCGYQDARTPLVERREMKRKFHEGEMRVLCNISTLTMGVDYDVRCLVLARPTRSEMLYQQIIGRALRTAEGKDHCVILDHSDTTARLGLVTDIWHDHLDDGLEKPPAEPRVALPKPCPSCSMLFRGGKCPNCGFEKRPVNTIMEQDGKLQEIIAHELPRRAGKHEFTYEQRREFYAQLCGYGELKGYARGWAKHKFRERFGMWPERSWAALGARDPGELVLTYIKKGMKAWAMKQRALERAAVPVPVPDVRETYGERQAYRSALMDDRDFEDFRP